MTNITLDTKVDCSQLTIQFEGDEYAVGDPSTGVFIHVPEVAVDIIRLCDGETALKEIKTIVDQKYDDDVGLLDFIDSLVELELVYRLDSVVLNEQRAITVNPLAEKLGQFFFNKYSCMIYFSLILSTVILFFISPALLPTADDVFIFEPIGISSAIFLIVGWLVIYFHEMGHLLAAAKEKVPAKIQLNLRFLFLVAETDMTGLWSQPKEKRYTPFLAGIYWNFALLFICLIVQLTFSNEWVIAFARLIAFVSLYGVAWQFIIFLRTDLYYVLINWLGVSSLHDHGISYLLKTFSTKHRETWNAVREKDRRLTRLFAYTYIVGCIVFLVLTAAVQIPIVLHVLDTLFNSLYTYSVKEFIFWDSIVVVAVFIVEITLWLMGYMNARRDRRNMELV